MPHSHVVRIIHYLYMSVEEMYIYLVFSLAFLYASYIWGYIYYLLAVTKAEVMLIKPVRI